MIQKKYLLGFLLSIFFVIPFLMGCGSHQQKLTRGGVEKPVVEGGEDDPQKILINAVNSGDLGQVEKLINEGMDLNLRNPEGLTLIMIAINAQQFAVVEYLVNKGADLELKTESLNINPALTTGEYLEVQDQIDKEIKEIFHSLLNKESFDSEKLSDFMFRSIKFKNQYLMRWLLKKGVDPNFIRKTENGKEIDTPLVYLFTLKGVVGKELKQLKLVFDVLIEHPDIDVNIPIGKRKRTALYKAKEQLKKNTDYKPMVDHLLALGAEE